MILSRHNPREKAPELKLRRVVETPEREPKPEWLKWYETLKEGPLWDKDHHQFLESLKPNQEVGNDNRLIDAQLLHLLFLQQVNPLEAQQLYEQLKASKFWDSTHEQWLWSLNPSQEAKIDSRFVDAQLLHLLFLQQVNPLEAQQLYERLKASKFWDADHDQFRGALNPKQEVRNNDRHADVQLLHLLYLQQTDPAAAQWLYRHLTSSPLWDQYHDQFRWYLNPSQEVGRVRGDDRYADAQLLHILYLQHTNPPEAHRLYEDLKAKLWDKDHNQFLESLIPNQEVGNNNRYADDQLLGILVEKGFADLEGKTLNLDVVQSQPVVANF